MPLNKKQKTKPKSPSHFKSQLSRASFLETQLSEESLDLEEETRSNYRIELCEIFSELILQNPSLSLKKDVYGRLWRGCFYARIGELRSRISKEKKRKNPTQMEKLEGILKTFLKEGIALYKYLTEKYESMLVEDEDSTAQEGVVAGLHRLYIYLGDLYRYALSYQKAEGCYLQASRLAPSKGNPYNQLAVVAQLKDANAPLFLIALYYYARSLLATHDPFPTSRSNLERLLQSNRDWLQNTSEQALLESQTKTYAQKVEKARVQKSVASRLFLARLVDVHYDFFRDVSFTERQEAEGEMVEKMTIVLTKLDTLLKDWAFGDALLMKMVSIHAFSVETTKSKTLARALLLRFGASLAERLQLSLKKALEKQQAMSLRLLTPLLLLSEYVSTWSAVELSPENALSTAAREFCVEAQEQYFARLALVATQLLPLRNSLGLDEMEFTSIPSEYQGLEGFKPFATMLSRSDNEEEQVYLSSQEAARVLELSSTPANSQSQSVSFEENACKLKRFFTVVDRMVDKKQPICCVNGQYRVFNKSDNVMENEQEQDESEGDDDNAMIMMNDDDEPIVEKKQSIVPPPRIPLHVPQDQNDGMLEYKPSEGGAGPALLVPGALLLEKTARTSPPAATAASRKQDQPAPVFPTKPTPVVDTNVLLQQQILQPVQPTVAMEVERPVAPTGVSIAPPAASLGPPPGLLPPPGFGAPSTTTAAPAVPPLQQQQPAAPMAVGYAMYPPPPPPVTQPLPDGDTVLQMLRGMDTNTANPFMTSSNVDSLFQQSHTLSGGMDEDVDGMSLLDSSLLSSMMMDDNASQPRSRNPFLT